MSTPEAPSLSRDDDTPESSTGQGDCDIDDDCLDRLKCGQNNCKGV